MFTLTFGLSWYRELSDADRPGMLHLVDVFDDGTALCRAPVSGPGHSATQVPVPRMAFVSDGAGDEVPPGAVCVRCAAQWERMMQARRASTEF